MTVSLSVIIPAFNEARQLAGAISRTSAYLHDRLGEDFELIVVDDGSTDDTMAVVRRMARDLPFLRLLRQPVNRGKGAAVKRGMLEASGKVRLFTDADGSTSIEEVEKVLQAMGQGSDVVIASRQHKDSDIRVYQRWLRRNMGKTFNLLVRVLLFPGLRDTQCGFKAFTDHAARTVFSRQTLEGFAFDAEILYLANRAGLRVVEIPVAWVNVKESRVHILGDSARMLRDLLLIRWRHGRKRGDERSRSLPEKPCSPSVEP
jgi:dolichyl-phosphate beta-glucosyltransferase